MCTCVGVFSFPAVEPDEDAEVDDDHVTNEGIQCTYCIQNTCTVH